MDTETSTPSSKKISYGKAYQRGKNFPSVFVIAPQNRLFLQGVRPFPASRRNTWDLLIPIIIWGVFFTGVYHYALNPSMMSASVRGRALRSFAATFSDAPERVWIIAVVVMGGYILHDVYKRFLDYRLATKGQIYLGKIDSVSGRYGMGSGQNFFVTLNYRFRLPDGQWLSYWETNQRNDLDPTTLPSRLEEVAVLYLNHREKILL